MKFAIKLTVLSLAVLVMFSSCVSNKKYNMLMEEKEALAKSLAESQDAIKKLEQDNAQLMQDKDALSKDIAAVKADLEKTKGEIDKIKQMVDMKEKELQSLKGEVESAFADYQALGLTVDGDNERLYISMPEKVLFKSGSARLDKDDKAILAKMAGILKGNADLHLRVEGHTDDAALVQGAAFADNWDLSVARSVSVVRELIKQGVTPTQVTAAGSGEYSPAVTENPKSMETRKANRRTEFVLEPNLKKIYDAVN
ncbi:MAG: OmpA family protein [Saprospirales bacterium]|nr:OmpA family protein [Saprospirales bacterium]